MKDMPAVTDIDRVAGIMTALISGDTVETFGKDIDDFTLSFVAPLNTNDGEIPFHFLLAPLVNVYPHGSSTSSKSAGARG